MKPINRYLSNKIQQFNIKATDDTILKIVKNELDHLGHDADLNHIDVSDVTNMSSLFSCAKIDLGPKYGDLNPDISQWNVSNVKDMYEMFYSCKNFNQDLSQWDVSKVKTMGGMFHECENFNQDLSQWDVSKVENMQYMFYGDENFNKDISNWDVSSVKNMSGMFWSCKNFNQDLSSWDVRKVENMYCMFFSCPIKEEFKPRFKK